MSEALLLFIQERERKRCDGFKHERAFGVSSFVPLRQTIGEDHRRLCQHVWPADDENALAQQTKFSLMKESMMKELHTKQYNNIF